MHHVTLFHCLSPLYAPFSPCISAVSDSALPRETAANTCLQFLYRFTRCGELSLGLFSTGRNADYSRKDDDPINEAATAIAESSNGILIAHIVSTKSRNETVLDEDMAYPEDWQDITKSSDAKLGHKEDGRTICIHSLAVLPQYQRQGFGRTLMKAYIQRMQASEVADRIALLAHDNLVSYYEQFGFENVGPSKATFGGGGWRDMVCG